MLLKATKISLALEYGQLSTEVDKRVRVTWSRGAQRENERVGDTDLGEGHEELMKDFVEEGRAEDGQVTEVVLSPAHLNLQTQTTRLRC